ncbi:HAD family hydrolase [Paenibacillus pinistramenti]|uniref:HAD family hydrolase n=1 Tax=Paenibacillus pinistramenti TaxID=1768003 RepID=UPI0011094D7B|nr:HAD family hydrolase [Paenibacillus pinistramenti]
MPVCRVNGKRINIRGILFDKDGTLLDFVSMWGAWAHDVTELVKQRVEEAGAELLVEPGRLLGLLRDANGHLTGYDPAGPAAMATEEQTTGLLTWQLYAAGMPWNDALREVKAILHTAMEQVKSRRTAEPMPGLVRFAEQCRELGISMGVVTADRTSEAWEHLSWMKLDAHFGTVVGTDRVKNGKPEPDMVLLACSELDLAPGEVLVIGDSNADMQMGKAAGAALAIGYCPDGESRHLRDADIVIRSYEELKLDAGSSLIIQGAERD